MDNQAQRLFDATFNFGFRTNVKDIREEYKKTIEKKEKAEKEQREQEERREIEERRRRNKDSKKRQRDPDSDPDVDREDISSRISNELEEAKLREKFEEQYFDDFMSIASKQTTSSTKTKSSKKSERSEKKKETNSNSNANGNADAEAEAVIFNSAELKNDPNAPSSTEQMEEKWRFDEEWDDRTDGVILDKKWCFPCKYSLAVNEADRNPDFARLIKLMDDNTGSMDELEFATMVQEFYNKYLRDCHVSKLPWAKSCIYDHIYEHRPNFQRESVRHLKRLKNLGNVLYRSMVDETGNNFNYKGAEIYLKIMEKQEKLHKVLQEANSSKSLM